MIDHEAAGRTPVHRLGARRAGKNRPAFEGRKRLAAHLPPSYIRSEPVALGFDLSRDAETVIKEAATGAVTDLCGLPKGDLNEWLK